MLFSIPVANMTLAMITLPRVMLSPAPSSYKPRGASASLHEQNEARRKKVARSVGQEAAAGRLRARSADARTLFMGHFRRAALCLAALAALPFAASAKERPPEIAITVDDLPVHGPLPAGETRLGTAEKMIAALKAAGLRGVYGFANGGFAEANPGSDAALTAWRKAGFPLGNHSWSHANLNDL